MKPFKIILHRKYQERNADYLLYSLLLAYGWSSDLKPRNFGSFVYGIQIYWSQIKDSKLHGLLLRLHIAPRPIAFTIAIQ
jgi:hypothetical protein